MSEHKENEWVFPKWKQLDLPEALIPQEPDIDYLRGIAQAHSLPALLRGNILAVLRKLERTGNAGEFPVELEGIADAVRMSICPDCGDKRCPRANDRRSQCTVSAASEVQS